MLLARRSADRAFYPSVWDVVGGHCAEGESLREALVREVEEELGVTPSNFEEVAVFEEPYPGKHGEGRYHLFMVTAWLGGEPRLRGSEHSELRWVTLDQALTLPLAHPDYGKVLRSVLDIPGMGDHDL